MDTSELDPQKMQVAYDKLISAGHIEVDSNQVLMDMFFDILPHKRKRRAHFNDFMQDAQERIHKHREAFKRGETKQEDPIPTIAEALAEEASVLCFDEFTVTDIADAMILGRLFEAMFNEGVVVIATSNVEPQNLYTNGLKTFL